MQDKWPRAPQGAEERKDWIEQIQERILETAKIIKTTERVRPETSWFVSLKAAEGAELAADEKTTKRASEKEGEGHAGEGE